MAQDWWIGLSGWVLQDGNYTDFAVGQVRQFALDLSYRRSDRLVPVTGVAARACAAVDDDAWYRVTAEVLRAAREPMSDCFVLDFGLCAYTSWMVLDDLEPPTSGAWLAGDVMLSVDPFEYMDRLARFPEMPSLIYTWTVEEIRLDTSPWIRVPYGHPLYVGPDAGPMRVRDPERRRWVAVDRTRMWDDPGSYTLRCTLHAAPPVSTMAASGPRSPYGPLT